MNELRINFETSLKKEDYFLRISPASQQVLIKRKNKNHDHASKKVSDDITLIQIPANIYTMILSIAIYHSSPTTFVPGSKNIIS